MSPIEAARAVLARRYPDIGADDDALCADCFANVHVRDGAEWENGHDVCDECASNRLSRTERALTAVLAEADRLTRTLACERGEWAPEGWRWCGTFWGRTSDSRDVRVARVGGAARWSYIIGTIWIPAGDTALEAIEAANAAIRGAS